MARTVLKFDKINRLTKAIPYREYFGKMLISPEQMRSRIELAEALEDVFLYLFLYWDIAEEAEISTDEIKQDTISKLTSVVEKHTIIDPYLEQHRRDLANEVVDVTERQEKKRKEQEQEDADSDVEEILASEEREGNGKERDEINTLNGNEKTEDNEDYWLSSDRAMLISENEANAIYNYDRYRKAKQEGKTQKVWITELDDKVRLTHTLVEGETVDIDGLFFVGGSYMRFPMDTMYDPSPNETINCRCVCEYK